MIVVVVSDLHNGSQCGMWAPDMADEDQPLPQNAAQRWLDARWWEMLIEVADFPRPIYVVVDGDPIQGLSTKDGQLMTGKVWLQAKSAYHYLKPLRELCDRMYMVHGTAFHDGAAGKDVQALAESLDCWPRPDGARLWWELYLDVEGHMVHFTHHVEATKLPFYEATAPLRNFYVLVSEAYREWGTDMPPVELIVRAHRHRAVYVHKPPRVNAVVTPCWQLKSEFPWKTAPDSLPSIGYLVLEATRACGLAVRARVFPLPKPHIEVA